MNLVNILVKRAKMNKELKIAKEVKNNPKALFKYNSSKIESKEAIANLIKDDDTLTTNDLEKSHVLNMCFSSVFVEQEDGPVPDFTTYFNTVLE